jgi:hypothetical protein
MSFLKHSEKERSISSLELPCWRDYSGCWETNSRKWKAQGKNAMIHVKVGSIAYRSQLSLEY